MHRERGSVEIEDREICNRVKQGRALLCSSLARYYLTQLEPSLFRAFFVKLKLGSLKKYQA